MANILIAGCGEIGSRLGENLADEGHKVWGLKRNPDTLPTALLPLAGDLARRDGFILPQESLDVVVYTAAADGYSEAQYRRAYVEGIANLLSALTHDGQQPRRILLVSSTSVYAQHNGEWVDEDSPADASGFAGRCLREGEDRLWHGPYPATVVRFGGIYGPGRTRMIDSVRNGTARCTPGVYSNRIHSQDCARVLQHLMTLPEPAPLYMGVDDDPAPLCEVQHWLAERLGVPGPQENIQPDSPAQQRRRSNKRCRNTRLRASGFDFIYPAYRQGYAALLADSQGRWTKA